MGCLILFLALLTPLAAKGIYVLSGGSSDSLIPLYISFVVWGLLGIVEFYRIYPIILLKIGRIAKALSILERQGKNERIQRYVNYELPVPEKFWDFFTKSRSERPRKLIKDAVDNLFKLRKSARDIANPYVPKSLKEEIHQGLNWAFEALWDSCQCLAAVTRQDVDRQLLEDEIKQENGRLQRIIDNAKQAQVEFAKLTFVHRRDDTSIKITEDYFSRFSEEAKQLRYLNEYTSDLLGK
jgi:hypothetical protein